MKNRILTIGLAVCMFPVMSVSCLSASDVKETPVWINDPYSGYSDSRYVAATGTGQSANDAEDDAAAAVGKVLRQSIVATEKVHETFTETSGNASYLSDIMTSTSLKDISGLTVTDRWTGKDGICYARAVLDRTASGKVYVLKINALSEEIENFLETAGAQKGSFAGCRAAITAYKKAQQNDIYLDLLDVIKPEYKAAISAGGEYKSSSVVDAEVQKIMKALTILVMINGDPDERIAAAFKYTITAEGVTAADNLSEQPVPYILSGTVSLEKADNPGSSYYYTRYTLDVSLSESSTNKIILQYSTHGRAGKLTQNEADQSALRTMEKVVKSEFRKKFIGLFAD